MAQKKRKNLCLDGTVLSLVLRAPERTIHNTIMIRFFEALCKATLKENWSDEHLFHEAVGMFGQYGASCPKCGASGKLAAHGGYPRNLVSYENGAPFERRISPPRFMCSSCGATHALLPSVITPYSPYSLHFKLTAVAAYFERDTTVNEICEHFRVAISTLYAWVKLLGEHKGLLLGRLASREEPAPAFLGGLFECSRLPDLLGGFFLRHGVSFMQNWHGAAAGTAPAAARSPPP